jgi:hypothetical protein
LGARQSDDSSANGQAIENEYDGQNMQYRKEAFLAAQRNRQADDYLRSTGKLRCPVTKSKPAGRFPQCSNSPSTRTSPETSRRW